MPKTDHTPEALQQLLIAEPDLVDRIFDYVIHLIPEIAGEPTRLDEAKTAVRSEFKGARPYIKSRSDLDRQAIAHQVLSLFNGKNTTEVARRLGISRATVYRLIKQPGRQPAG